MANLIEIVLTSTDNTAAGFASARANLSGLQSALDADRARFASLGAGAQAAQTSVSGMGVAAAATGGRVQTLSQQIQFQQRALEILGRSLDEARSKGGTSAVALDRQQLAYDRLAASIQRNTGALGAAQAAETEQAAAQGQNATSAERLATINAQIARTQMDVALRSTDAAGKVQILTERYEQLSAAARQAGLSEEAQAAATLAATRAQREMVIAQNVQNRGLGPTLPRSLEQFGTGALMQAGIATGGAILGQQLIQLGNQSTELAMRAETIGTAYEGATRRARLGADSLLDSLKAASRGTVSDTELMASANKAMALGVGQNVGQIGDLLAIARQKGKDFGESTQQAFEDITIGLGRLSPRILDNLGIILDEKQIYDDYAKSIGVATGKLSDQEKRQALVNDLIKNNSDLIGKNAQAQLDAADKAAQATARQQTAETRLGQALLPVKTAYQETFATILEGLTGITRETDQTAQQKLLAGSSSFENYREQSRKRTQDLYNSGDVIGARQNAMDMVFRRSRYGAAHEQAQADVRSQAAEARTARDDVYMPATVMSGGPATAGGTAGSARFSPGANAGGTTHIYVTVQGNVTTQQDLVDAVHQGIQQKKQQNGYEAYP